MMYGDDDDANGEAEEGEQDDESRELTYEEIWDDSALINAWNAATEEYEVCDLSQLLDSSNGLFAVLSWTREGLEEGAGE